MNNNKVRPYWVIAMEKKKALIAPYLLKIYFQSVHIAILPNYQKEAHENH